MEIRGRIPTAGISDAVVTVEGNEITHVEATSAPPGPPGPPGGDVILPGLIDIHCHGGGGHTFSTTDPDEALAAAAHHASAGTTGMIASLVTAAATDMLRQVRALAPLVDAGELLGIHLEGPFLSVARRGAQSAEFIRDPDQALAQELLAAGGGAIKIVTIAPERPGAPALIDTLRAAGAVVAFGHTDADYASMAEAFSRAAGTALVTHLPNGMPPLHHRAAGPAAAALVAAARGEASVELIADGVHVDPGFTRLVFATAAPGRVVLVTDAMAAAGMPDGCYDLGPRRVRVSDGVARLAGGAAGDGGSLAGGTSSLSQIVARARAAGVPEADAVRAASQTPARVLGLPAGAGQIAPGSPADLVLTDESMAVRRVMRGGRWLS
jgi:N-acetylglucosamine-6-phosphate deacetylase